MLTNKSRLKQKYGNNLNGILIELNNLVQADKKRDFSSKLVFVDDDSIQSTYHISPVDDYKNYKQNKIVIDAIYKGENEPDYLVIIGAIDVIPHQVLLNPVQYSEKSVLSDLPYAYDNGYSNVISDFIYPTRSIGRIPDVTGGSDSDYLLNLLKMQVNYTCKQ